MGQDPIKTKTKTFTAAISSKTTRPRKDSMTKAQVKITKVQAPSINLLSTLEAVAAREKTTSSSIKFINLTEI